MDYTSIQEQAQRFVRSFFDQHTDEKLVYHNLYHTEKVVEAASLIARHYHLNDRDLFIVTVAAWFHDIGYLTGTSVGHEQRGAQMAESWLTTANGTNPGAAEPAIIDAVKGCIMATKMPQSPTNQLENIVCDADLFHLGTDEFEDRNKLMRKEAGLMLGHKISKEEWRRSTIVFLEGYRYHTDFCQSILNAKKRQNLETLIDKEPEGIATLLRDQVADQETADGLEMNNGGKEDRGGNDKVTAKDKDASEENGVLEQWSLAGEKDKDQAREKEKGKEKEKDKDNEEKFREALATGSVNPLDGLPLLNIKTGGGKDKKVRNPNDPGRGVDTMFKIASTNHQRLSRQGDAKAHILIQVNSIIISVLLSLLLRKIDDHQNLIIPAIILLSVNLLTIIFSILATRPHISAGTFTKTDVDTKKVNLLFFGNYYRSSLQEYTDGMLQVIGDKDFLYGSLIKDLYFQGIALGRKYRWLRLSYNIFMFGLIISVAAFVIAALAYPSK